MSVHTLIEHVALGAAAGGAATFLLQGMRTSEQKLLPETMPPMRDPGAFMLEKAEELIPKETREQMPATVEKVAGKSLALGYGMPACALYCARLPRPGKRLSDGTALGLGVWAVGY